MIAKGKHLLKDEYRSLKGLLPEVKEIEYNPQKKPSLKKEKNSSVFIKKVKDKEDRKKKIFGNKGEYIVYNWLVDKYGKINVFPRSEAFVEIGILKPGQASSGEYDLWYKDEAGRIIYVEVKTTGDGQSFIITPGELEFAKKIQSYIKFF